ncbi:MAG: hypothetical protein ABI193_06385 [Minicystis sp.]
MSPLLSSLCSTLRRRPAQASRVLALATLTLFAPVIAPSIVRAEEPPPAAAAPALSPATARPVMVLPTMLAQGEALRLPAFSDGEMASLAASLDALLGDAAQDLGLAIDADPAARQKASNPAHLGDAQLLQRARGLDRVLLLPTLRAIGGGDEVELRLALAGPAARSLHVRSERVARRELSVRALIMLRDLVATDAGGDALRPSPPPAPQPSALTSPARGAGRPVLLVTTTLFGGLVGYSIQRASGSDDPRVLYPLLAVGAGIGLGSSIIASEEWDIGVSDAWYVAAGELWPTLAGHLIYQGRFSPHIESDRWLFSLIGGGTGVTLSVLGLTLHPMSEGGAILAHSGGGLGLVLGGFTEALVRGDIHTTPVAGMGYGAAVGWLSCAALATQLKVTPTRILALDLGALLGGLGGAAAGSPLLLNDPSAGRQRAWAGLAGGASIVGATIAVLVTREGRPALFPSAPAKKLAFRPHLPTIGVLGESVVGAQRAPIMGLGWGGTLP